MRKIEGRLDMFCEGEGPASPSRRKPVRAFAIAKAVLNTRPLPLFPHDVEIPLEQVPEITGMQASHVVELMDAKGESSKNSHEVKYVNLWWLLRIDMRTDSREQSPGS